MALIDLIEDNIVRVPLSARDKDGVILELIGLLASLGKVSDKAEVYRAVMEREAKGSTGLEDGVAVPHGKTPAVKGLTIAIGIAPAGVDFASQDGKPSKLFFLILAPPDQAGPHIEALAEIARLSQSQAFCRTLTAARSGAQVVSLFRGE